MAGFGHRSCFAGRGKSSRLNMIHWSAVSISLPHCSLQSV
ncbi:hypothetical protein PM8797T_21153 [Gimesia maris DSM 8797]|nr:hypothetical protein PM8797T_21153 [Gimesia maris DSM 8797]